MIRQAQSFVGKLKNILWNQYNRSGIVCYNGLPQNSALRLEKPRSYSTTSANNTTSDTEAKDGQGKKYPETPSESASQKNTTADSNSTTTETQQAKDEQQQRQQQQKANISLEPEDLVQQIQEQEQQISQLKELSLRAYAEMENVRKIAQRDVDNAKKYSIGAFAKDLLDVADNLERALQNIPKEKLDPDKGDTVVISLYEGVKATNDVLQKVFQRYGIVRYDPMGEKFDPNQHQAVFEIPDNSSSGVVLAVAKTGYRIQDRILRPAEVGVSKATKDNNNKE